MSEFDIFVPFYDLEFAELADDVPLYLGYAERTGGPLLELACGTGRLLLPLAASGYQLTGVDLSPAMLARARMRLANAGLSGRVTLIEDDMQSLARLGEQRFRLAFCGLNSFLHLPDQPAQLAALRAARRHLDPGGLLMLDVFHPHPDLLVSYDGRLVREARFTDPATGAHIDKFVSRTLDAASQTIHTTFYYDRLGPDGVLQRTVAPFIMRYIYRYELLLLLAAAGFEIEDLLGGYDLAPFAAGSQHLIAVARPRAD